MSEDRIYLRDIEADIIVGILPEEQDAPQPLVVNITLFTDCLSAALSDSIEDAVDYSVIHDDVLAHMHSTHYGLIETLAENLATLCLRDKRIHKCIVAVDKPKALKFARSVAVEIARSQR